MSVFDENRIIDIPFLESQGFLKYKKGYYVKYYAGDREAYYSFISNKLYIEREGWYSTKWKKRIYTRHKPFDQFEFLSLINLHSLIEQWNGNIR